MSQKTILVVDDSKVILKSLSIKLKSGGYEILTALDGAEALGKVRRYKPDLILVDISFPPDIEHAGGVSWDGFVMMDWLRRMEEAKNIPVMVISGSDPAKYRERALAAGALAFFQKPINYDELLAALGKTLGETQGESRPETVADFQV